MQAGQAVRLNALMHSAEKSPRLSIMQVSSHLGISQPHGFAAHRPSYFEGADVQQAKASSWNRCQQQSIRHHDIREPRTNLKVFDRVEAGVCSAIEDAATIRVEH